MTRPRKYTQRLKAISRAYHSKQQLSLVSKKSLPPIWDHRVVYIYLLHYAKLFELVRLHTTDELFWVTYFT